MEIDADPAASPNGTTASTPAPSVRVQWEPRTSDEKEGILAHEVEDFAAYVDDPAAPRAHLVHRSDWPVSAATGTISARSVDISLLVTSGGGEPRPGGRRCQ